ncbi:MAG: helix-turn-helix domain-containing protein [Candidatus Magasanikbacteria bacterium]|nr:helix-turn-helix domain-containing protein [Candidatus Magasanikbacteria bacterium]
MLENLKKILVEIGLPEKEAQVLFVLIQHETLKASDLARKTRLNRTTLYGILKSLTALGLVTTHEQFGITVYSSIDPALLPAFLEQKREALRVQQTAISELLGDIQKVRDTKRGLPRLQFFEGWEGLKQAYEDTLEHNKEKIIWDFTGTQSIAQNLDPIFLEYYMSKRARLGIKCIQVAPDNAVTQKTIEEDKKYLRETFVIPTEYEMQTEFVMYDNKVTMLSFAPDRPLAVIIEDENIANSLKTLFKYVKSTVS